MLTLSIRFAFSRCLKLYCQCFSASTTCGSKCRCDECYNTSEHGPEIDDARRTILARNPVAFYKSKVLLYQQQHDQRQSHLHPVHVHPHFSAFPHPMPSPMHGPYYGTHPPRSTHVTARYYPGASFHRHPQVFQNPSAAPSGPTYPSGTADNASPTQQQLQVNPFYRTPHNYNRQSDGSMKSSSDISRPSVVEISPEIHAHSRSTSSNQFQLNRGAPPTVPPRRQMVQEGCNCRRTNCLKKYCECYQQSIYCCGNCKCVDCKNTPGSSLLNNYPVSTIESKDPCDLARTLTHSDHRGIKLHYRPEQLTTTRMRHIHDPRNAYTALSSQYLESSSATRDIQDQPTTPPIVSHKQVVSTGMEQRLCLAETQNISAKTNSTSAEEDSPRCVVQETVKPRPSPKATADDAMIQAAMAMTELLNGLATSTSTQPGEQKATSLQTSIPCAEFENNDIDDPSLSKDVDTGRPSKKLKMTGNGIIGHDDDVELSKTSTGTGVTRTPHDSPRIYLSSRSPQHHHWTPLIRTSAQPSPPYQNTNHQRCLPMLSRSPFAATTSSSSSSSNSSESNDYHISKILNRQIPTSNPNIKSSMERYKPFANITLTSGLPKSLSFRKICSRCGRTRSEHGEMGFGNSCSFENCGCCGASARCHQRFGQVMGVLCQLSVSDGATLGASAIYHRKLQDLAAHADLERQNIHRHRHVILGGGGTNA